MDVVEKKEDEDNMTLRRMRLRRKTDPKTGKHTLCEPAQAKCTWTFHKSHFVWIFFWKNAGRRFRSKHFVRACASRNAHGHFTRAICVEIYRKNAGRESRARHFVRACAVEPHMNISQEPFCVEKCRTRRLPPRSNTGP